MMLMDAETFGNVRFFHFYIAHELIPICNGPEGTNAVEFGLFFPVHKAHLICMK